MYDLFLCRDESRVCRNIVGNEVQKDAYKMESPLFDAMNSVIAKLLELDIPDMYKMLIRRSRYVFSINYGKALDSLDGDQNNAALVLNTLFDESSGGGDPSLFLDSPVTQHQLFHMFTTEY